MAAPHRIEEVDETKELVRQAYDALNRGAIDEFGRFLSDNFQEITRKGTTRNKNECLAGLIEVKKAMPDVRYDIQEIIAEGDRVAVVENYSGTMKGPMRGSKPTGKKMSVTAVDVYKIKNGKLTEVRSVFDMASLTNQLGIQE